MAKQRLSVNLLYKFGVQYIFNLLGKGKRKESVVEFIEFVEREIKEGRAPKLRREI